MDSLWCAFTSPLECHTDQPPIDGIVYYLSLTMSHVRFMISNLNVYQYHISRHATAMILMLSEDVWTYGVFISSFSKRCVITFCNGLHLQTSKPESVHWSSIFRCDPGISWPMCNIFPKLGSFKQHAYITSQFRLVIIIRPVYVFTNIRNDKY